MSVNNIEQQLRDTEQFDPRLFLGRTLLFAQEKFPDASDEAQQHVALFSSAFIAGMRSFKTMQFGQRDLLSLPAEASESDRLVRDVLLAKTRFVEQSIIHDNGTRRINAVNGGREKHLPIIETTVQRYQCNSHPQFDVQRIQNLRETGWTPDTEVVVPPSLSSREERLGNAMLELVGIEYVLVLDQPLGGK